MFGDKACLCVGNVSAQLHTFGLAIILFAANNNSLKELKHQSNNQPTGRAFMNCSQSKIHWKYIVVHFQMDGQCSTSTPSQNPSPTPTYILQALR